MRAIVSMGAAVIAMIGLGGQGMASQMSDATPEIAAAVAAMGNQLTPDVVGGTMKLYAPLHAAASKAGVKVTTDVRYGDAPRNLLDVYTPDPVPGVKPPIMIFAHGGGFVRGDKKDVANIGYYFAQHGVVVLAMSYRFAPDATWPSGGEDVASVIKWIKANPDVHGGDTGAVFVAGNSAGAAHAATYAFFEDLQVPDDGVKGVILISIPTADTAHLDMQRDTVYYGTDASAYPARSVIDAVDGRKLPVFLAVGEFDMPSIQFQNHALVDALFARDQAMPTYVSAQGHNHISIVEHFGTADETLAPDILEFIRVHAAR